MEKNLFVKIKAFLVVLFCFLVSLSYSTDVRVFPYEIDFDYDTNSHQYDALSVSDSDGDLITLPEWYDGDEVSTPAYIINQSARKIKVRFGSNDYSGNVHLIIRLTYQTQNLGGIGTLCDFFVPNYSLAPGYEPQLTLNLTGNLPGNGKYMRSRLMPLDIVLHGKQQIQLTTFTLF